MFSHDLVRAAVRRFGLRPALVDRDRTLTFGQLWERIERLAFALIERGVVPGSRVVASMPNRAEWLEVEVACSLVGGIRGRLNWRDSTREWAATLDDLRPTVVVVAPAIADEIAAIRDSGDLGFHLLVVGEGGTYEVALADARPRDLPRLDPDWPAIASHTSGTTGRMKAAVYTHRAAFARHRNCLALVLENAGPDSAILHVGPVTHMSGLLIVPGLFRGARSVLLDRFTPEAFCEAVERERISHVLAAPTIIAAVTSYLEERPRDLSSLVRVMYGSSPIAPAHLRRAMQAFGGSVFMQGYGSSEGGGLFNTVLYPEDHVAALGGEEGLLTSCGRPTPFFDVRVTGEDGQEVAEEAVGELWVRGDAVSSCYWNRPELSAVTYVAGWFRTGDLGWRDARGYVTLVDRKHDMIISGGLNIYPNEVEAILVGHPSVAEVAVIGVPDARWGEMVKACVMLRPGRTVSLEELQDFCRDQGLAHYKKPLALEVLPDLPRTAVGKISRRLLRGDADGNGRQQVG